MRQNGFEALPVNAGGGGEAGDTNRGLTCLRSWIGTNESRFNVVSWNFGLHDLGKQTWNGPNSIPVDAYARNLLNISRLLARRLPVAKQLYITTTPVPLSSALSPPRNESDVVIYNKAAIQAMTSLGVPVLDLWAWALNGCGGDPYVECPIHCADAAGGQIENCLQRVDNVHFWPKGYIRLTKAIAAAVEVVHSGTPCPDFLINISIGLCKTKGIITV